MLCVLFFTTLDIELVSASRRNYQHMVQSFSPQCFMARTLQVKYDSHLLSYCLQEIFTWNGLWVFLCLKAALLELRSKYLAKSQQHQTANIILNYCRELQVNFRCSLRWHVVWLKEEVFQYLVFLDMGTRLKPITCSIKVTSKMVWMELEVLTRILQGNNKFPLNFWLISKIFT